MSELPPGWASAAIGDLVKVGPKNECSDSTEVGFVPMQRMGTRFREVPTFEAKPWSAVKKGYTPFADGDVLVARITPCFENGKGGIPRGLPNGLGAGSTEFVVLRPKPDVLVPEYLLALLKTDQFLSDGKASMTGAVGQQRVPKSLVLNYKINLAPYGEQKRIAKKLDAVLARVDACRERLDRVPLILKKFREAVLEAALSGRLTEEWRDEHGSSEWRTVELSSICGSISDGDHQAPPRAEKGVPFITISAINDGRLRLEKATRYVPESYYNSLKAERRPSAGDILFSVTGSIAIPALVDSPERFTFQRHIAILKPDTSLVLSRYLLYSLGTRSIADQAHAVATGIAQLTVPLSGLRAFTISLPPVAEQTEIVRRVDELFALADGLEAKYRAAVERVERLTPAVLAKAFRGELVPQDPSDEPAEKLVERIRKERASEDRSGSAGRGTGRRAGSGGRRRAAVKAGGAAGKKSGRRGRAS